MVIDLRDLAKKTKSRCKKLYSITYQILTCKNKCEMVNCVSDI